MTHLGAHNTHTDPFDLDINDWGNDMWEYLMFEGRRTDDGERFRMGESIGPNRFLTRRRLVVDPIEYDE